MGKTRKYHYSKELGGVGDEYGWAYEQGEDKPIRGRRKEEIKRTSLEYQRCKLPGGRSLLNATVYDAIDREGQLLHLVFDENTGTTWEVVQVHRGQWNAINDVSLLYALNDILFG